MSEWKSLTDEEILHLFGVTAPIKIAIRNETVRTLLKDARMLESAIRLLNEHHEKA